jgi:hypothetical protein
MKRVLVFFAILLFAAAGLSAQAVDYDNFSEYFQAFATEVANSLPITASVGGNWSPAHIGQFPHLGVGVSLGGMFLPYKAVEPVISNLGFEASIPAALKTYGVPFPAIAVDARLGGFILPFDIGVKFGFIPEDAKALFSDKVTADYLLAGADVRLRVIEGRGILPTLSAGAGYNYMQGALGINDVGSGPTVIDIESIMTTYYPYPAGTYTITVADPDLVFSWQTHTIQAKAHASWDLAILTPHVGFGAAHGFSQAGGGLFSSLSYQLDNGTPQEVADAFEAFGYPIPTAEGIEIVSDANGWSFWVYGGTAFNIGFIVLDVSALYNFLSGAYGASANVRLQL